MNKTLTFSDYLNKTFVTLGAGLAISTIIAFLVSNNIYYIIYSLGSIASFVMIAVIVGELGVAIFFGSRLMSMSKSTAWGCYIVYAILTGLSLSTIFAAYDLGSIVFALASTCILFVCMAVIGRTTKVDFSNFRTLFSTGLIAMIIMSLLNGLLFHLYFIDLIMMYLGVIIFLGLIAYDIQKLRDIYSSSFTNSEMGEKMMIYGAFELYLDFINLFIRILQIFGRRRNDR